MKKALFYIENSPIYMGYTNGARWNGWATPFFTLEEAQKIQAEWNIDAEFPMLYDVSKDEFRVECDEDEPYIWKGEDIQTVDGIKHLYGIGAYSHRWDEIDEVNKRYLAHQIIEIIEDIDPYEYHDSYDNEDECLEAILAEFADIDKFAKAHSIMNSDLKNEDKYEQFSQILKL